MKNIFLVIVKILCLDYDSSTQHVQDKVTNDINQKQCVIYSISFKFKRHSRISLTFVVIVRLEMI